MAHQGVARAPRSLVLAHSLSLILIGLLALGQTNGAPLLAAPTPAPPSSPAPQIPDRSAGRVAQLESPREAERLRQMFLQSHLLAIQNYHEHGALQSLTGTGPGHSTSSSSEHTVHVIPLVALGGHHATSGASPESQSHQFVYYQNLDVHMNKNVTSGSRDSTTSSREKGGDDDDEKADSKLAKLIHHDANFKNDARQSALFPGLPNFGNTFGGGGLGGTNPLGMGGLLNQRPALPTLPSLPTFKLPTLGGQQQPRQPKTSVIGNSGGPMALTNDNVVVVNVLSGNY